MPIQHLILEIQVKRPESLVGFTAANNCVDKHIR